MLKKFYSVLLIVILVMCFVFLGFEKAHALSGGTYVEVSYKTLMERKSEWLDHEVELYDIYTGTSVYKTVAYNYEAHPYYPTSNWQRLEGYWSGGKFFAGWASGDGYEVRQTRKLHTEISYPVGWEQWHPWCCSASSTLQVLTLKRWDSTSNIPKYIGSTYTGNGVTRTLPTNTSHDERIRQELYIYKYDFGNNPASITKIVTALNKYIGDSNPYKYYYYPSNTTETYARMEQLCYDSVVENGNPVIFLASYLGQLNYYSKNYSAHYLTITGYDSAKDVFIIHDTVTWDLITTNPWHYKGITNYSYVAHEVPFSEIWASINHTKSEYIFAIGK